MTLPLVFLLDLVAIAILVFALYFPRHRRRDMVVAYLVTNLGLVAVTSALTATGVSAGLGFGLFAVLSIIRLRSAELDQQEVAYYFAAMTLGLLGGLVLSPAWLAPALMVAVLAALAIGDAPRLYRGVPDADRRPGRGLHRRAPAHRAAGGACSAHGSTGSRSGVSTSSRRRPPSRSATSSWRHRPRHRCRPLARPAAGPCRRSCPEACDDRPARPASGLPGVGLPCRVGRSRVTPDPPRSQVPRLHRLRRRADSRGWTARPGSWRSKATAASATSRSTTTRPAWTCTWPLRAAGHAGSRSGPARISTAGTACSRSRRGTGVGGPSRNASRTTPPTAHALMRARCATWPDTR